jgi:hypothetical protein
LAECRRNPLYQAIQADTAECHDKPADQADTIDMVRVVHAVGQIAYSQPRSWACIRASVRFRAPMRRYSSRSSRNIARSE